MIYAVQAIGTPYIKFGYSGRDVTERMSLMQTGCPLELKVIATCPGGKKVEADIHKQLFEAGAHHRGEWFKDGPLTQSVLAEMHKLHKEQPQKQRQVVIANRKFSIPEIAEEPREPGGWRLPMKKRQPAERFPRVRARALPVERLTKVERRRAEREAWWRVHSQQYDNGCSAQTPVIGAPPVDSSRNVQSGQ